MSPMNWTLLYIFSLFILILINVIMNYIIMFKLNSLTTTSHTINNYDNFYKWYW